jgi:hypothetical protein
MTLETKLEAISKVIGKANYKLHVMLVKRSFSPTVALEVAKVYAWSSTQLEELADGNHDNT